MKGIILTFLLSLAVCSQSLSAKDKITEGTTLFSQGIDRVVSHNWQYQKRLELSAKAANYEPFMMFGIGKDFIVVAKSKEGYALHTFVPSADSIGAYTHTEETLADPRCDEVFNTPIVFNHKQVQNCKCQEHYDSNDMYFYISNTHGEMYGICFPIGYTNNGKDKHAHFMLGRQDFRLCPRTMAWQNEHKKSARPIGIALYIDTE